MPNRTTPIPFVIIADDAFPLKSYIMKPFARTDLGDQSKRIFNYRLSRARRTVENAFGILANRFRVFQKPIYLNPEKVDKIVLAACVLHNYLISHRTSSAIYNKHEQDNFSDITGLSKLTKQGSWAYSTTAKFIRNEFTEYFMNEGAVPWQWNV